MSNFPEGYQPPAESEGGSLFTKFEDGENRLRIMSDIRIGWEYWTKEENEEDGKSRPVRSFKMPLNVADHKDTKYGSSLKEIAVMFVYNYKTEAVELLSVGQATIKRKLFALSQDEDYGADLNGHDIVITKKVGARTSYDVTAKPPKQVEESIATKYDEMEKCLDNYLQNENPFKAGNTLTDDEVAEQEVEGNQEIDPADIPF